MLAALNQVPDQNVMPTLDTNPQTSTSYLTSQFEPQELMAEGSGV